MRHSACHPKQDHSIRRGMPAAIAAKVAALVFFKKSLLFQLILIYIYSV
jgi:hypothetical protein